MAKYRILTQEGRAKRGQFETVHGTIETPLHTLARFYRKDPDVAVSCETMPGA